MEAAGLEAREGALACFALTGGDGAGLQDLAGDIGLLIGAEQDVVGQKGVRDIAEVVMQHRNEVEGGSTASSEAVQKKLGRDLQDGKGKAKELEGEEDDNVESPYGELAEQGGIGFAEPDDGRGSEERPREEAEGEVQQIVEGRLEMATSTGGA